MEQLQQELADVKQENDTLKDGIVLHQSRLGRILQLENENQQLKQQFEELAEELADVRYTNGTLMDGIITRTERIDKLKNENHFLTQQLQATGNFAQPDYEAARDRTLNKLKVGKQSTAGKAIQAFIKELTHG